MIDVKAPKNIVNKVGLAGLRILGNRGRADIWFPPYITKMAPTSTDGEITPISTPAAHDVAIMDRLMDSDWNALLKTASESVPMVR